MTRRSSPNPRTTPVSGPVSGHPDVSSRQNTEELDFAFKTPTTGPSAAPQFPNFSPLFSYASPSVSSLSALAPSVDAAAAAAANSATTQTPGNSRDPTNAIRRSPRLQARKQYESVSNVFSPSGFLATPKGTGVSVGHTVDSQPLEMPPAIQSSMSALGRYQRHVHQTTTTTTRPDQDVDQQMDELKAMAKRPRLSHNVDVQMMPVESPFASRPHAQNVHNATGDVAVFRQSSITGVEAAKASAEQQLRYAASGPGGSSCHQCKNRREANQLNFCCNKTRAKGEKRKICRKKYCDRCLKKFNYHDFQRPEAVGDNWECPACRGICVCAACKRKRSTRAGVRFQEPAFSFAQNIISDPQFFGGIAGPPH